MLIKSKCVKISHFKCVYFGQPVCENSIFRTTHVHNGQLQSKQFMCAHSFETLIRNFAVEKWKLELKLRNSKLKLQKNFQIFLETFISESGLVFKFGVINWFTKQITKFVKCRKKVSRKIQKIL